MELKNSFPMILRISSIQSNMMMQWIKRISILAIMESMMNIKVSLICCKSLIYSSEIQVVTHNFPFCQKSTIDSKKTLEAQAAMLETVKMLQHLTLATVWLCKARLLLWLILFLVCLQMHSFRKVSN